MSSEFDIDDFELRMDGAVEHFKVELSGLRTGRASVNLLDPVTVEAYGSKMPMSNLLVCHLSLSVSKRKHFQL